MKLYAIVEEYDRKKPPRLVEADVVRETKAFYIIEDAKYDDFGYKRRIEREAAHLTPEGAWKKFADRIDLKLERAEQDVEYYRTVLSQIPIAVP